MNAWSAFWSTQAVSHQVLAFALVAAVGLAIGRLQYRNIGVGIAGVLFSGLLFGHFGIRVDHHILEFIRELGLILFVFSIGLQLGPGFFASLRRTGLKLNLLAAGNVSLGVLSCIGILHLAHIPLPVAAGLLSGATTNTPSLAAAQQVLRENGASQQALETQGAAYALAYPFGVCGVIIAMLLARRFSPRSPHNAAARNASEPALRAANLQVINPGVFGRTLSSAFAPSPGVTISRLSRRGKISVPALDTVLEKDDLLLAVGPTAMIEKAQMIAGGSSSVDLRTLDGPVTSRRMIVTHSEVVGKSLASLQLQSRCGVAATRLYRHGMELVPEPSLRLQLGDVLHLVGTSEAIVDAGHLLGDAPKELEHTRVGPLFFGILLGVLLGMLPIALPGMPTSIRLGLAGGPLVVAILLGRIGSIGPIVWYVPANAGLALREIGIVLFLACVGLKSGDLFFHHLFDGAGLAWAALGAAITIIPILFTAWIARRFLGLPLPDTCGVLAGSMTDPPALAFAQKAHEGSATSVAYATVYPLTMLLRVVSAQVLIFVSS